MSAETAESFMRNTPRADLQHRGQFWTPEWVARAMASYVVRPGCSRVFDPSVGAGALLIAAKRFCNGNHLRVEGFELYPEVLALAGREGLSDQDLRGIQAGDYLAQKSLSKQEAILCNPPYLRHHRIAKVVKTLVRSDLERWLGVDLDGRLGLHGYFFLRSLQQLQPGGRLCYITSADLYEGKSAKAMWSAVASKFRIDGIVTFSDEATPFPGVDTNTVICMISAEAPKATLRYVRILKPGTPFLEKIFTRIKDAGNFSEEDHVLTEERNINRSLE